MIMIHVCIFFIDSFLIELQRSSIETEFLRLVAGNNGNRIELSGCSLGNSNLESGNLGDHHDSTESLSSDISKNQMEIKVEAGEICLFSFSLINGC